MRVSDLADYTTFNNINTITMNLDTVLEHTTETEIPDASNGFTHETIAILTKAGLKIWINNQKNPFTGIYGQFHFISMI